MYHRFSIINSTCFCLYLQAYWLSVKWEICPQVLVGSLAINKSDIMTEHLIFVDRFMIFDPGSSAFVYSVASFFSLFTGSPWLTITLQNNLFSPACQFIFRRHILNSAMKTNKVISVLPDVTTVWCDGGTDKANVRSAKK